jgi:glycosyltransferase involved in cell wall biosynthesis
MQPKILIFIPMFNCERQISRVIEKINPEIQSYISEVLLVDNKSNDDTIAEAIKCLSGLNLKAKIFRNKENYSLGGSIKSAFLYAEKNQYDYMITLHGDDQADIRDFVPILQNKKYLQADMIIGARFHPESILTGYSLFRTMGNKALNIVCALINKRRVHDLIAGINLYNVSFFKNKFYLKFPNNLTFDAHVLLYAFSVGARVEYVPITWREEDQISNAKVVAQAITILKLFGKYVLNRGKVFQIDASGREPGFEYPAEVIFEK